MTEPMLVEIIAYAPTAFYHCTHCEVAFREVGKSDSVQKEQLNSSLPPDLMDDYRSVSDWVREMLNLHGDKVVFRVIDAATVEGVLRSVRHGTRRFPCVVVNGATRFDGSSAFLRAAGEIQRLLPQPHLQGAAAP